MATAWRNAFAAVIILALASGVWTSQAAAQQQGTPGSPPAMMDKEQSGGAKHVEGKIQKVSGNTVTLTDGTVFTIPASVKIQRSELKPGASVKASYEEKAGQKVVTSLEVEAAR